MINNTLSIKEGIVNYKLPQEGQHEMLKIQNGVRADYKIGSIRLALNNLKDHEIAYKNVETGKNIWTFDKCFSNQGVGVIVVGKFSKAKHEKAILEYIHSTVDSLSVENGPTVNNNVIQFDRHKFDLGNLNGVALSCEYNNIIARRGNAEVTMQFSEADTGLLGSAKSHQVLNNALVPNTQIKFEGVLIKMDHEKEFDRLLARDISIHIQKINGIVRVDENEMIFRNQQRFHFVNLKDIKIAVKDGKITASKGGETLTLSFQSKETGVSNQASQVGSYTFFKNGEWIYAKIVKFRGVEVTMSSNTTDNTKLLDAAAKALQSK